MQALRGWIVEMRALVRAALGGGLRQCIRYFLLSDAQYNARRAELRNLPSLRSIPETPLARFGVSTPSALTVDYDYYDGCMPISDLAALMQLCQASQPQSILEIGTSLGQTSLNLALVCPQAQITTIDIVRDRLTDSAVVQLPWGTITVQRRVTIGQRYLAVEAVRSRVHQVIRDSRDWPSDDTFDFVFIDAGHDYASVLADSTFALRVLSEHGTIVWDDYECSAGAADVPKVLEELADAGLRLQHVSGTRLVVYRAPQ